MYNLTVALAHTFVVGENGWVVHNVDERLAIDIVRFTQSSVNFFGRFSDGGFYTIAGNARLLAKNPAFDLPPIHVFEMTPNVIRTWGPVTHPTRGFTGYATNLQLGQIYTLDNRRLLTYQMAGRADVPVFWSGYDEINADLWKATTQNAGIRIDVRIKNNDLANFMNWCEI